MNLQSGKQPTVMKHDFSTVPHADIPRSTFNRSHGYKTTLTEAGKLYPFFIDEALPGDTLNLNVSAFGRLATPINPIMDNLHLDTHFFAVPYRLIWDNWQKFCGEQDNPGDSTDFLIPQVTTPVGGFTERSLYDYFGIPTKEDIENPNNLFGRAYNLIYNEWFRDENIQTSITVDKGDGPDNEANYTVKRRGKRHDYFTSCLPWPQKGDAVNLPIGTSAPITGIGAEGQSYTAGPANVYETDGTGSVSYANYIEPQPAGTSIYFEEDPNNLGFPNMRVDLTNATASTINEIREAFQVQKLYERDARGGTRYTEIVKAHFGVTSPDSRLQRPEYLGGGTQSLQIHPIAQTSSTDVTTPQGNLSGVGTVEVKGNGFNKSFTEHCVVMGLVSVRADLSYQQGLERMHTRRTRLDHYWPVTAHIGEQAVLKKEIYANGGAGDQDVFGYQERWAEYRYKNSLVTGSFRSNATLSLDSWHLCEEFSSRPSLSNQFINDNPPVSRVIAVPTEDHLIFDAYLKYICARPMPTNSVPGLVDHF